MFWVESRYASQLGAHVRNFKRTGPNNWTFSCPICGDSKKKPWKARGNVFKLEQELLFHCFRCGVSKRFGNFLKDLAPHLHQEMQLELLAEEGRPTSRADDYVPPVMKTYDQVFSVLDTIQDAWSLVDTHPVRQLMTRRKLQQIELYYTEHFWAWVNTIVPGKYVGPEKDEARLVIPFRLGSGQIIGVQGRALNGSGMKYATAAFTDEPMIWGQDRPAYQPTIVFEGPIDASFIRGALATAGGDMTTLLERWKWFMKPEEYILAYDNEPRSDATVKKMLKAAKKGYRICVWPTALKEKDVNDMILAGNDPADIRDMIIRNSYTGSAAEMQITWWKK